jgi:hypothetical protein
MYACYVPLSPKPVCPEKSVYKPQKSPKTQLSNQQKGIVQRAEKDILGHFAPFYAFFLDRR